MKASKPEGARRPRWAGLVIAALAVSAASPIVGCRVNNDDLQRWERTEHGPDKLAAVLSHSKYELELRIAAAMSLIEMKKRGGQSVGMTRLIEELTAMTRDDRHAIIDGVWKKLQPKIAVGVTKGSNGAWTDPSVVYKDAAFMLYSDEKLDFDAKTRDAMTTTLTTWAVGKDDESDSTRLEQFDVRMENGAQQYGLEQVVRRLGLPVAVKLPGLLKANSAVKSDRLDSISRVIVDAKPPGGDSKAQSHYDKAREELSTRLAEILKKTLGPEYLAAVQPEMETVLKESAQGRQLLGDAKLKADYFEKVRGERLAKLFPILKQVGRKPIVDALRAIAIDPKAKADQRALSLAALQGNLDNIGSDFVKDFIGIAKSDAPDEVKHGALQCISAAPPDQAVRAYYELFDSPNWKVRFDGAMLVLQLMSKVGDKTKTTVREFLDKLPARPEEKIGLGEGLSYAHAFAGLPKKLGAKAAIDGAIESKKVSEQVTALAWYMDGGTPADAAMLAKYAAEKAPIPKCDDKDECGWEKPGCATKVDPKTQEGTDYKPVTTVGEYVTFCVLPEIERRAKAPKTDKTDK